METVLSLDKVTAVLITRGDTDLQPVLDSLVFPTVVVWDNSGDWMMIRRGKLYNGGKAENQMTYSRLLASSFAPTNVIYSADDDIIHTPENQMAILAAYEPGKIVGCMWDEWSDGAQRQGIEKGYSDLVFAGSGSVYDRNVARTAAQSYLDHFPEDDFFRLWCDTIVGVIAPTKQLNIRFDALPCAENDNRMCNLPDAVALKTEAINRARWVRDEQWVRATA